MKTNNAYMHFSVMYVDIYWGWRSFIFVKDLYAYLTKNFSIGQVTQSLSRNTTSYEKQIFLFLKSR